MKPKTTHRHLTHIVFGLSLAACFSLGMQSTQAAAETWTGATATWNTAGNWTGTNLPPISGDSLIFGAAGAGGTTLNNDLTSAAFTVAGITFNAGASAFTIGGNAFTLTNGITKSSTTAQVINNAITLSGNQSFSNASATGPLTLGGTISGSGVTLTTSAGAAANVAANTLFTGAVTLGSLVSQGTAGNNQTSAPQSGGIYTTEQSTTFNNATLNVSGNAVVGRSTLIFTGSTVANITGSITKSGSSSPDWASVVISGAANVTAASLNLAGDPAQTGQFYLNGGTLTIGSMAAIDSTQANFVVHNVFNGTQVIASQSNANFLTITKTVIGAWTGGSTAYVGNNGALFNTNGFNIGTGVTFANDTGATGSLTKTGSGTLTLTGASTYTGPTTINGGTLKVNGSLAADSAVAVNGGASLGGTGTVNGPVTVASGSTPGAQGEISLADGAFGTLTLSNAAGLTLGGSAGNLSKLKFDVGTSNADLLSLESNVLTVGAGGASITIDPTGISAGNSYDLVSFGGGAGAGFSTGSGTAVGGLMLANPNIVFGVSGSLTVTEDRVQLVTSGSESPATAYWSGVKGTTWASNDGTNGNFTLNANGTGFAAAFPSAFSEVIFAANGNGAPTNLTNTLGQDFHIYSLKFASGTAATTISGTNQLTVNDGGISLESGNGGATLGMATLALGAFQTWSNESSNPLAISAVISGTNALTINSPGTGNIVLSGANTFSGGLTLSAGTVQTSGSGTLGDPAGALTVEGGALDLNGTSQSVGILAGPGGTILNNATGTNATLTIGVGDSGGGIYEGVISDNTSGTGTVALTKTGNGMVTLSGANSYSGKTSLNGGNLFIGTGENIPNASVLEFNNGAKLNIQAFTETIGGLSSGSSDLNLVQNQEMGGTGAGTLIIDTAGSDFTFTGIIRDSFASTGTLALVKNGAGTQKLRSTTGFDGPGTFNNFTGGLTINGGTLLLSDSGNGKLINSVSSDPSLTSVTATLALENTLASNTQTLAKVISGSGNVEVTAANLGIIVLNQANTYTGNTSVGAGTLSLTQPYLADTSTVSISNGAVLNLTHASNDVVGSLILGGVIQLNGVYDSSTPGGYITGTGKIQVGALSGFALWASLNAPGQTAEQDYDNDGMKNGVEYFMGESGSTFTANPAMNPVNNKIIWPKDPAYSGTYTVQTSPDLVTWTDVASSEVGNTVEFTVPDDEGVLFTRLKVTPN